MSTPFLNSGPLALIHLSRAVDALLEGFDDRSLRIIRDRIIGLKAVKTLEEFGREFGLTRERIRQIEVNIRKKLQRRLSFPSLLCIKQVSDSFTNQLGVAFPQKYIGDLKTAAAATNISEDLLPILLWQGGPFGIEDDWIFRQPVYKTRELLDGLLPGAGVLEPESVVQDRLIEHGVQQRFCSDFLRHFECRSFSNGTIGRWRGSLADKAFLVLASQEKPMSREAISGFIPEEHSIRTLGNYLFADERFARVSLTEFALASWGAPKYKGIVPEICEEIVRRGGEATLADLRDTLIPKFGISEHSVVSYLSSPFFTRTLNGGFRIRREDEAVAIQSRPELMKSCFLIDGSWGYRLQIDSDLVRGSGRNVPSAFAAAINLEPGDARLYGSEFGDFRVSWLGSQPSVGSNRLPIEKFQLSVGDWLYLLPLSGWMSFFPLRLSQLAASDNERSLFLQCCPDQEHYDGPVKSPIAVAIGLRDVEGWTAIRRRFLERREKALYDLVPDVEDELDQASIDELFAFLGTEAL